MQWTILIKNEKNGLRSLEKLPPSHGTSIIDNQFTINPEILVQVDHQFVRVWWERAVDIDKHRVPVQLPPQEIDDFRELVCSWNLELRLLENRGVAGRSQMNDDFRNRGRRIRSHGDRETGVDFLSVVPRLLPQPPLVAALRFADPLGVQNWTLLPLGV